jgi:FMN phosphatase YigB (HAD superfamily)
MEVALDKTIQEFKMWPAMCRKPGHPAAYLREVYEDLLQQQHLVAGGKEKHPEIVADQLWEAFIKKLLQKNYVFDAGFYGSLNEFSRKVAYFFHASVQGTAAYEGAARTLRTLFEKGLVQGLLADGQCFTAIQLQRALAKHDPAADLDAWVPPGLRALSHEIRGRKPSERLFQHALVALAKAGIPPDQVLHVGSRLTQDIAPARRQGMRTALFAGHKASLQATPEQLKDAGTRPDVLVTRLDQICELVS